MKNVVIISEKKYQKIKRKMNKNSDYFNKKELTKLMQFLMQRQRKTIKNEVKI